MLEKHHLSVEAVAEGEVGVGAAEADPQIAADDGHVYLRLKRHWMAKLQAITRLSNDPLLITGEP